MATAEEITAFRLLIDEADDRPPYDDIALGARIDGMVSSESLAAQIWREKAATYSALVNVSESGSSRNLSDLHKNAIAMAETFGKADPGTGPATRGVRMNRLTRS